MILYLSVLEKSAKNQYYAPVAQLVEHLTFNQGVRSSHTALAASCVTRRWKKDGIRAERYNRKNPRVANSPQDDLRI